MSLSERDYEQLRDLAEKRRPALSIQYVTEFAVQRLLEEAKDPGFARALGDPLAADGPPRARRRHR